MVSARRQTIQVVGFVTGAAVVTAVNSYRTAGIGHLTFGTSAFVLMTAAMARPAPQRTLGDRAPSLCRYCRRLLMNDSTIEPSSPSSGRIAQAIRYSRMPSP